MLISWLLKAHKAPKHRHALAHCQAPQKLPGAAEAARRRRSCQAPQKLQAWPGAHRAAGIARRRRSCRHGQARTEPQVSPGAAEAVGMARRAQSRRYRQARRSCRYGQARAELQVSPGAQKLQVWPGARRAAGIARRAEAAGMARRAEAAGMARRRRSCRAGAHFPPDLCPCRELCLFTQTVRRRFRVLWAAQSVRRDPVVNPFGAILSGFRPAGPKFYAGFRPAGTPRTQYRGVCLFT
jgi:hypothetical protein